MSERPVIGFDCVETVFSTANIPRAEISEYVAHTQRVIWSPLLPPNSWSKMPAHPDAVEGIARLRSKFRVVTCSNLPLWLLHALSEEAGIQWDAIVPLEASQSYKPNPMAYAVLCQVMQVEPDQVLIVSAHPDGPDAVGAPNIGMELHIIRQPGCPQTITELAEQLGC